MTAAPGGRRVDGVLFDVDDTLVDTSGAFAVALAQIAARYLPDVTPEQHGDVLAMWRADAADRYAAYTRGETTYRAQRRARANDLHAAFGGPELDEEAYDAWNAVFEAAFSGAWAAHTEAAAVVGRLLAAGVLVGGLSNASQAYQSSKLAAVGLGEQVPLLVGVDTLGVGKPDPRVFVEACRRLGTDPARTAYVGDELDVDALAAVRAGLVGVWVDRAGPRRVPVTPAQIAAAREAGVLVVATLDELPEVLGVG